MAEMEIEGLVRLVALGQEVSSGSAALPKVCIADTSQRIGSRIQRGALARTYEDVNDRLSTFIRICEALQVSSDSLLRADVPEVNSIYQNEFSELLSDCSPTEIDTILRVAREMKAAFHERKASEN